MRHQVSMRSIFSTGSIIHVFVNSEDKVFDLDTCSVVQYIVKCWYGLSISADFMF